MSVRPDHWIKKMALEHKMIEPFIDSQVREGADTAILVDRVGTVIERRRLDRIDLPGLTERPAHGLVDAARGLGLARGFVVRVEPDHQQVAVDLFTRADREADQVPARPVVIGGGVRGGQHGQGGP